MKMQRVLPGKHSEDKFRKAKPREVHEELLLSSSIRHKRRLRQRDNGGGLGKACEPHEDLWVPDADKRLPVLEKIEKREDYTVFLLRLIVGKPIVKIAVKIANRAKYGIDVCESAGFSIETEYPPTGTEGALARTKIVTSCSP